MGRRAAPLLREIPAPRYAQTSSARCCATCDRDAYAEAMTRPDQQQKRPALIAAFAAFLVVAAYSAWAVVQILVLNPLAAVPGATLERIYAEVEAAGQSMDVWLVVAFLAVGPLVMLALMALAALRPLPQWLPSVVGLSLLTVGPLVYWWASIAPSIGLADTYLISGGDHSPWAWPLVAVSVLALVVLVAGGLRAIGRSRGSAPFAFAPSPSSGRLP